MNLGKKKNNGYDRKPYQSPKDTLEGYVGTEPKARTSWLPYQCSENINNQSFETLLAKGRPRKNCYVT